MLIRYKFLLILLLLSPSLFPGNTDSIINIKKNNTTRFFTANQFEYADSNTYTNNSLYQFQNYLSRNHLGNTGLAFSRFSFQTFPTLTGFHYSTNNFAEHFYTPRHLKFYNTRTPYTDLFYVMGSKAEQFFKMTFSYNVKKNWNVSADFSHIRSEGFYQRQSTNDNFIAFSTNYKSKNERYYVLAGLFYNNIRNDENGGIVSDSAYENAGTSDKKLVDVNLQSANRKILNRNVYLKQYLNFGRKSNDTATRNGIIPGSRLILTSCFDDNLLYYNDEQASHDYYPNFYYDLNRTYDSAYHSKIENELAWKRIDNKKHRGILDLIGIGFSGGHQLVNIKQREIDITFNNIIAGAALYNTYSNHKLWWNINGKYVTDGFNKNNYNASAIIKKGLKDSLSWVSLQFETRQQNPDFIFYRYSSNHFRWNNIFELMQHTSTSAHININKYSLATGTAYNEYTNVVYFDNYAVPRQYTGSIGVISAYLKKDFTFYNWHLNNTVRYQQVPDSMVIRLPEFILEHSLYYENNILKGAARIQIGVSVFYNSAYYANSYMPVTGQFYLQNDKKYGNYPVIDFFVNARIRTVRVFIKIDHLNSGWMGNKMLIPYYPMNDRAFKIGVSWRFFN